MRRTPFLVIAAGLSSVVLLGLRVSSLASSTSLFPSYVGGTPVTSIYETVARGPGDDSSVSGFLTFDYKECGQVPTGERCSGLFLWEHSIPDNWYGGSRLYLATDDIEGTFGKVLGGQEWGVPVVVSGTLVAGACSKANICEGSFNAQHVNWSGTPVDDGSYEPNGQTLVHVGATKVTIADAWVVKPDENGWTIGVSDEITLHVRPTAARFSDRGVVSSYPEAHGIGYEYRERGVIWRVEQGNTYQTRTTIVGYDDGFAPVEIEFVWSQGDLSVALGLSAIAMIQRDLDLGGVLEP